MLLDCLKAETSDFTLKPALLWEFNSQIATIAHPILVKENSRLETHRQKLTVRLVKAEQDANYGAEIQLAIIENGGVTGIEPDSRCQRSALPPSYTPRHFSTPQLATFYTSSVASPAASCKAGVCLHQAVCHIKLFLVFCGADVGVTHPPSHPQPRIILPRTPLAVAVYVARC